MGLRVWSWAEMSSKKNNKKTGAHKAPPPIITKVNTIKDPDPNHEKEPESDPHKEDWMDKNSGTKRDICFHHDKDKSSIYSAGDKKKKNIKKFRNLAFRSKLNNIREQIFNR